MLISKNIPLIVQECHHYDMSSCAFRILQGYTDSDDINGADKTLRNIQIGLKQKDNRPLSVGLNEDINDLMYTYLENNGVDVSNIIIIQKDGLIVKNKIKYNQYTLPLDYKYGIIRMINTIDRKKYLVIKSGGEVEVKGVPNKPIDFSFYNLFRSINFSSNKSIVSSIDYIKKSIYNSDNIKWFTIKSGEEYYVPLRHGKVRVNIDSVSDTIHVKDINKEIIWQTYIYPFISPIIVTYLTKI